MVMITDTSRMATIQGMTAGTTMGITLRALVTGATCQGTTRATGAGDQITVVIITSSTFSVTSKVTGQVVPADTTKRLGAHPLEP